MDRVIKFRGKLKINEQWIFGGYLAPNRLGGFYEDDKLWTAEVYPKTVGEFTGFKDFDDKKIFEGDIVKCDDGLIENIGYIDDYEGCWCVFSLGKPVATLRWFMHKEKVTVIGNIHDNPELLEGGKVDDYYG